MPTVQINEYNGGAETKTANIANSNFGSVDSAQLDPTSDPIVAGENSFEKWQKLEVTDMGVAVAVRNIKVWLSSPVAGGSIVKTNARTSSYGGSQAYAQPVDTVSSVASQDLSEVKPASANVGIGGSLSGELSSVGLSDYVVFQLQTNAADTAGASSEITWEYEEVA